MITQRQEEILKRVYDCAMNRDIPILLKNNEYVLIQSINTCYNTDMEKYKCLLKSMISNNIFDLNIVFVIFIDINTTADNVMDIINLTYDIIGKDETIYFIIPRKHTNVVYARTIIFNFVVNMFKSNFILSFSDDDDIHCDLKTLYEYGKSKVSSDYIIPLRAKYGLNVVSDVVSHPAFWRFLFPWRVFYTYPMTLDIVPVNAEDQRFVARMIRMEAFKTLSASNDSPIKYYYENSSKHYDEKYQLNDISDDAGFDMRIKHIGVENDDGRNLWAHPTHFTNDTIRAHPTHFTNIVNDMPTALTIPAYMSVFDYRIYKTQEWMLRIDRTVKSYGTYTTNSRRRALYTDKQNIYAYSENLTIPTRDKAIKITSWDIKGNEIIPTFDSSVGIQNNTAASLSEYLPNDVVLHPDEIIVCNVIIDGDIYKYASFPMNIMRRSKLSKEFGQVELIEPYESWTINLHEHEKMNVIHGGHKKNIIGFVIIAFVILAVIKLKRGCYKRVGSDANNTIKQQSMCDTL